MRRRLMDCEEVRQLLDPYVDGELDLTRQLAIEAHLAECNSCREAAQRITSCSRFIRVNLPVYRAPPGLKSKVRTTLANEDKPKFRWFREHGRRLAYAAALLLLSCALAWTWLTLSPSKDKELIAEAVSNHSRSLMVSHLVDCASGDQHAIKQWFDGKVDYSPPVADLTQAGYTLVGGRIDILEQRPVAAIVYQHGKNLLNLFVWPATSRKIDMDVRSERGYHFCAWNLAGLNFFCISEISAADLEKFEDELREKINL
ncbi:MAG: anti-sigma factor [Verrucomicrobia bacterium]|nr:anti-sigma factor [Verrucomicrobiota bacterium]